MSRGNIMTINMSCTEMQEGSKVYLTQNHVLKYSREIIKSGTSGIVIIRGHDDVKVGFEMDKDEDGKPIYDENGIWISLGLLCWRKPKNR